ncbi:acyl-CoA dehydrogenase family protein [Neobacillus muris]|uniref:acyl-CoA dehydrogenase family protein n=1 Tax=Neobacillus muris TaxID=2941334 RepID=UPI00203B7CC5|nr:acyl-CoA dehydrogenase family protein [Neobacillus muris]
MNFQNAMTTEERLAIMEDLSNRFLSRAHEVDEAGRFPFENIQDLKETGYTFLTVPKKYGGKQISLYELLRLQELIAMGDGSTSLAIGWHMGIIMNLHEKQSWQEPIYKNLCEEVKAGALINSAATEPKTGSPTRGGRPETTAKKSEGSWLINGRKTFTTMSPVLDYFIVSASIEDTNETANFLIPRDSAGVQIEETWDSIALRGTGSHDLVLNQVRIPEENLVEKMVPGKKSAQGWLLHIPACYLGIAKAARKFAIAFANEYAPNNIQGPIISLPAVRQKIGEMELKIMQAEYFLYGAANQWDHADQLEKDSMGPALGAAKLTVTNLAVEIVDIAMRLVGARSLSLKNPLQRYYRDVRAGLHNPPMDDMTIQLLAAYSIENLLKR